MTGEKRLRLVVFDVDGTLVDSEGDIFTAMQAAFESIGNTPPSRAEVRSVIGLSLDIAFLRLSSSHITHLDALVAGYKAAYMALREAKGSAASSPLFPGARAALDALRADPGTLLAVATGKSRRGLDKLIEGHGLHGVFTSLQTADHHPSKPHPAMLHAILRETGADPADAVMVGDTSYDTEMARAAGMASIGVRWGYHPPEALSADALIADFAALPGAVESVLARHRNQPAGENRS